MSNSNTVFAVAISIAIAITIPLILSIINDIYLTSSSANAQLSNIKNNSSTITTKDIVNMTKPGEKVVLRGIVSSEDFKRVILKQGENPNGATILPNRPDGTVYTGIVTFAASKPVEVGISHRLYIDNSTFSNIDTKTFGNLYSGFHKDGGEKGTPGELSVASVIVPDYGTAPPYFSASIPFVGDSIWLRTPHGEPFIAVYEVSADIIQPLGVVDLGNAINTIKNNTTSPPS